MAVTYALDSSVAVITIDDGKANAYSHEVLAGLRDALDRAEREAKAVLLVGREGRFSAGFDLAVMTAGPEPMRALVVDGARTLARLFTFPLPVIAACTGHALAAGALVLLTADHRIAADGPYKIGLNEVAIGMPLPRFAVELARYRMPPSQLDFALLGQVFDPAGAAAAGYVDRVVDPADLLAEAAGTAQRYAQLRSGAVARTKQAARGAIAQEILDTVEADMASMSAPSPG
ncbi:MAG: crotonase/enoyl-CoA hydratase family protein [Acidimicrobiales bacterium]